MKSAQQFLNINHSNTETFNKQQVLDLLDQFQWHTIDKTKGQIVYNVSQTMSHLSTDLLQEIVKVISE